MSKKKDDYVADAIALGINLDGNETIDEIKNLIVGLEAPALHPTTSKTDPVIVNKSSTEDDDIYIVETPVANFVGTVGPVQFAYGKAEVKKGWVLDWFREKGYKVTKK